MEMEDVDTFFTKFDSSGYFGERIKFQSGLKKWRKERNKPLDTGTLSPTSTRRVLELLEKISDGLSPASCSSTAFTSHSSESKSNETSGKDLTGLLKSSRKGQLLLSFYEKNGHLDNKRQKDLTHCIVERFVGTGIKMSYRDMNDWANAIAETFQTENKDTYFLPRKVGKKNPTGKLFSRWCNEYSTFNEKNEKERAAENKKQELMSNDFSEEKYWLQTNCSPWETVREFWQQTSKLRTTQQLQSNERLSLTTLLENWPRLNDANGFELIDIDFETLHPGKGNLLFTKFDNFYPKIKLHFEQDTKDKTSKEMLQFLYKDEVSKDSKDCITTLLLHSLLQPVRQRKGYKPTIADAQSDFVVHIRDINDLMSTIEDLKKLFNERNENLQPRIVAVGPEIYDLKEFYVFCDGDLKYKFCSYSKCLDTIVKLCSVYKIEYSQKSKLVWTFLERYFFEIECEVYSSVSNLINKLSKK